VHVPPPNVNLYQVLASKYRPNKHINSFEAPLRLWHTEATDRDGWKGYNWMNVFCVTCTVLAERGTIFTEAFPAECIYQEWFRSRRPAVSSVVSTWHKLMIV